MNKFAMAAAGLGLAVGGSALASGAPLKSLTNPTVEQETSGGAPLFVEDGSVYVTASASEAGGGGPDYA
ncbi:hypothetical protein [Rhodophyticola sp.]|jgi:hypothetical protein|uniref:hypothetical protein n=1 Tax=Rhodophyticola sp. TaxID=2680032 RepID=UPI003D272B71